MVDPSQFIGKELGDGLQVTHPIFTLIGLFVNSGLRYDGNLYAILRDLSGFELGSPSQIGGKFFHHPVGRGGPDQAQGILPENTGGLRGCGIAPDFSRNVRVPGLPAQKMVKTVHLPLAEPVGLVLQFIGCYPRIFQGRIDVHI